MILALLFFLILRIILVGIRAKDPFNSMVAIGVGGIRLAQPHRDPHRPRAGRRAPAPVPILAQSQLEEADAGARHSCLSARLPAGDPRGRPAHPCGAVRTAGRHAVRRPRGPRQQRSPRAAVVAAGCGLAALAIEGESPLQVAFAAVSARAASCCTASGHRRICPQTFARKRGKICSWLSVLPMRLVYIRNNGLHTPAVHFGNL